MILVNGTGAALAIALSALTPLGALITRKREGSYTLLKPQRAAGFSSAVPLALDNKFFSAA